jgi:hypothetical protein
MIIKTRAKFLEKLEAEIERDNETFRLLGICFRDQRPLENNEMQQFASIVLRDGLVDLDLIEKQIEKDEAILKQLQAKTKKNKRKQRKQQSKHKISLQTFGNFLANPLEKNQDANGETQASNKKQHSTQDGSTPEFPADPGTTF